MSRPNFRSSAPAKPASRLYRHHRRLELGKDMTMTGTVKRYQIERGMPDVGSLSCAQFKGLAVNRLLVLRIALIVIGLVLIFGVYTLIMVWPSGWAWGQGHSHYLTMILGVYATLGIFLLIASRNPHSHKSLIWFTVWSSVVHATIMGVQSLSDAAERGHLIGDVPALFLFA